MALDAETYPRSRGSRNGPPSSSLGAGATGPTTTPPTSRVFPFALVAGASRRSTASSGRLKGPAIVTGMHITKGQAPVGAQGWALGKASGAISEVDVLQTTAKGYTSLLEPILLANVASPTGDSADAAVDFASAMLESDANLGIIILDVEFFLTITIYGGAGSNSGVFAGHITLLEQVPPETIAAFP